jgi:hypothetical protein
LFDVKIVLTVFTAKVVGYSYPYVGYGEAETAVLGNGPTAEPVIKVQKIFLSII